MQDDDLRKMLEQAAELGAKRALHSVGLQDEEAGNDVRELRGLLDSWRGAKRTAITAIVQAITAALLGAMALGAFFEFSKK